MMQMKKFFWAVLIGIGILAAAPFAMAQVIAEPTQALYPTPQYCPKLSYNLYIGLTDNATAGQVSELQKFLSTRYSQPVTGYFGLISKANVAQFQRDMNIFPVTGGVGPITRGSIAYLCGNGGSQSTIQLNQAFTLAASGSASYPSDNLTVTLNSIELSPTLTYPAQPTSARVTILQSCAPGLYCIWAPNKQFDLSVGQSSEFQGYTIRLIALTQTYATLILTKTSSNVQPAITSISPVQGSIGTQVMIYGSGFSAADNTVHFGFGAIPNLSSTDGTHITFTVPEYLNPSCYYSNPRCLIATQQTSPGNYAVSVSNVSGQSSTINFTVTQSQNVSLSITSPQGSAQFQNGTIMPIVWNTTNPPSGASATVLDLYTSQGTKVGTIAISSNTSGSYNWSIPRVPNNLMCTMQYPNGLCGTALSGQYYLKASLVSGNGFDASQFVYSSATSGTFTIY
jgi:hypothetical protein